MNLSLIKEIKVPYNGSIHNLVLIQHNGRTLWRKIEDPLEDHLVYEDGETSILFEDRDYLKEEQDYYGGIITEDKLKVLNIESKNKYITIEGNIIVDETLNDGLVDEALNNFIGIENK